MRWWRWGFRMDRKVRKEKSILAVMLALSGAVALVTTLIIVAIAFFVTGRAISPVAMGVIFAIAAFIMFGALACSNAAARADDAMGCR